MLKAIFTACLMVLITLDSFSQELEYEIFVSDKHVGGILVTQKEISEEKVYYSAVTDVEYTLFKTTQLVYLYEAIYQNNVLESSYFVHRKNGELIEEAKLQRVHDSEKYISNKNQQSETLEGLINRSMVQLYFTPPNARDSIFSERFHEYIKIAKLPDENKYMFEIPNGDKNIYEYNSEGICTKIKVSSSFLKLEIILKPGGEK
ncbi:hypothetical protein JKA74_11580 [Marivirga sp. S37H4]|uniref:Uncharacterized protein n=1 Tax=Marivirga aurantiaca TaxID=2802615 RepID=A0A934WZI0_9BACT|nr:DUF6134 family protein [Marivirga aurantiaca]MBK6265680.1 hypothetical protein [Marivirga aurantiaca]